MLQHSLECSLNATRGRLGWNARGETLNMMDFDQNINQIKYKLNDAQLQCLALSMHNPKLHLMWRSTMHPNEVSRIY